MTSENTNGIATRDSLAFSNQTCKENKGECLMYCGYRPSLFKQIIFYFFVIITLGTILLLSTWKPKLGLVLTCSVCDLKTCKYVLIKDAFERYYVEKVQNYSLDEFRSVRFFIFNMVRYGWDESLQKFFKITGLDNTPTTKLLNEYKGFSAQTQLNK